MRAGDRSNVRWSRRAFAPGLHALPTRDYAIDLGTDSFWVDLLSMATSRSVYAARATTLGNLFATCDHSIIARLTLDFSTSSARVISGSIPFSISAFRLSISMSAGTPLPS